MRDDLTAIRTANIRRIMEESEAENKKEFAKLVDMSYGSIAAKLNDNNSGYFSADNARHIEKKLKLEFGSLDLSEKQLPAVTEKSTTEMLVMMDNLSIRAELNLHDPIDKKIRVLISEIMNLRRK